jgi:hypothetical protein
MREKTICRIFPALILALGMLLAGCPSHLQTPEIPAGLGRLHIYLAAGAERTLTPAHLAFSRYEIELSAEGEETIARSVSPEETFTADIAPKVTVNLAPLVWTITVRAYALAGDTAPIARGTQKTKIASGNTKTITLLLGPVEGDGTGSFGYDISLPEGLDSAILALSSFEDSGFSKTINLQDEGAANKIPNLAAGYYRLKLSLERKAIPLAGQGATLSEVVHIYEGAQTDFALSVEDSAALAWAYVPKPWLAFDHGTRITDADVPETQHEWEARNTFHVPSGQPVVLSPLAGNIPQGAVYEWTIDNVPVDPAPTGKSLTHAFTAPSSLVKVAARVDAITHATASVLVKAASASPRSGGVKAEAAVCIEFSPAPGQFVGKGNGFSNPAIDNLSSLTEKAVRDLMQKYLDGTTPFNNVDNDGQVFSLGGWGGYYILGFDHSVPNEAGADLEIPGNFHVAGMTEAGVVWVSQDVNGDGKPNELWHQLKGSQASPAKGYGMAYFKPRDTPSAFWLDNQGGSGKFTYYANGQDGYPYHITGSAGTYVMFTGTLLQDSSLNGYVDSGAKEFDISDAVDAAGNPVNLTHIDFVKVQTGLNKDGGGLGEYSTEAGIPKDLHFEN